MTVNEIREKFLAFFKSKEHTIVESDSLVPKDDPTVLFTTAGMQQFKRQFLGHIDDYSRATTSQKCMRTDDLDEVGETDFHHTFFEMLGNFSFGDYFKKEAICWAWEFLTEELNISKDKLWVSVYKDDDEAEQIWLKEIGLDKNRIVKLGDKSNFWPADAKKNGPNGPCGPCSEIFYDYGVGKNGEGEGMNPGTDTVGRFCEVWNLVFTQFNRKDGGELEALPNKNIDTGMGLERLAGVIQGVKSNFDTDVFKPILDAINKELPESLSTKERRIVADHMRGITFGISDGVVPSNEGRGYVIKKLIIDITDIALNAGNKKPVIYKLVHSVIAAMGDAYPELIKKEKDIAGLIKSVENAYMKVRQQRMPELKKEIEALNNSGSNQESLVRDLGELTFKYRDTFGLTKPAIESTLLAANTDEKLFDAIFKEYEKHMQKQQEQSRAGSKMTGDVFTGTEIDLDVAKTKFVGYEETEATAKLLKCIVGNDDVNEAKAESHVKIILDQTPFYAESGGQVGDSGQLTFKSGQVRVDDTQKVDDIYIHYGEVTEGSIKVGETAQASINVDRRLSIMRNHTATHLLQKALSDVLGSHVQQQGSLVAEDRLRFDFTHHQQINPEELLQIENSVNEMVRACDNVNIEFLPIEKARKSGALAFFAEKYGNIVRVVTIGDVSKEFCGGTHLKATGQIGLFKVVSESAIAQGIRRIEAKTGIGALEQIHAQSNLLTKAAKTLKVPVSELTDRIETQAKKLKQIEKDYEILKFEAIKTAIVAGLDDTQKVNGIQVYSNTFNNIEMNMLRKISDFLKKKLPSSLIILGAKTAENASILIASSDAAIEKGFKANELIKEAAAQINGQGGGRPQLAQAGGKSANNVDKAIESLYKQLKEDSA